MKKYIDTAFIPALLLLAALTGCPVQDSDDDSSSSGSSTADTSTASET